MLTCGNPDCNLEGHAAECDKEHAEYDRDVYRRFAGMPEAKDKRLQVGKKATPNEGPFKGRIGIIEYLLYGMARVRYEDVTPHECGVYAEEYLEPVE